MAFDKIKRTIDAVGGKYGKASTEKLEPGKNLANFVPFNQPAHTCPALSPALEQAIRSRIRDYCNSQMHKYGANLGAEIDELQWVLTQAGLEPEKEK